MSENLPVYILTMNNKYYGEFNTVTDACSHAQFLIDDCEVDPLANNFKLVIEPLYK